MSTLVPEKFVNPEKYLTVSEFARILRVSRGSVYRWVEAGNLPVLRLSETGAIRIPREALEARKGEAS